MPQNLSDIDRRILVELSTDSNRSRKLIARTLNISEPTLSKRIAALVDDGVVIKFTVEIDPTKIGLNTAAITLIKLKETTPAKFSELKELFLSMDECTEAYTMFGEWDVCVRWLCQDSSSLMNAMGSVLETKNIEDTQTITLANTLKNTSRGILNLSGRGQKPLP